MMSPRQCLWVVTLTVSLASSGCGDREPAKTAPPAPPAGGGKTATAPAAANTVPVACVAKWTVGATAAFECTTVGPNKDKGKVDKDSFRLDTFCVNDTRLTTFAIAGGQTAPIAAKGNGPVRCAPFSGEGGKLPESCNCVPPAGGDCTPPANGFACLAVGHVPLGG
jgi:hypothetical protein